MYKSDGASKLIYHLEGNDYDFITLSKLIAESPSILMEAQRISWKLPIGFIRQNETNGNIEDYFFFSGPQNPNPTVTNDKLMYVSLFTKEIRSFDSLINVGVMEPNYSERFHQQIIESNEKLSPGLELRTLGCDLFLWTPSMIDAPLILRKGSHIPATLISSSKLSMQGDRKSEEDIENFNQLIIQYKQKHENG